MLYSSDSSLNSSDWRQIAQSMKAFTFPCPGQGLSRVLLSTSSLIYQNHGKSVLRVSISTGHFWFTFQWAHIAGYRSTLETLFQLVMKSGIHRIFSKSPRWLWDLLGSYSRHLGILGKFGSSTAGWMEWWKQLLHSKVQQDRASEKSLYTVLPGGSMAIKDTCFLFVFLNCFGLPVSVLMLMVTPLNLILGHLAFFWIHGYILLLPCWLYSSGSHMLCHWRLFCYTWWKEDFRISESV